MPSVLQKICCLFICVIIYSCNSSSDDTPPEEENFECNTVANVLDSSVIIDRQESLVAFIEAGYTRINGTLEIKTIDDLSFLQCVSFVEELVITGSNVTDLSDLSNTSFDRLTITSFPNIVNFEGIGNVTSLIKLRVGNNERLVNFEGLNTLTSVSILEVWNNPSLVDFSGLENVRSNPYVQDLNDFEDRELYINSNPNLQSLNGLQNLQGALNNALSIYDCPNLSEIPAFLGLTKMTAFNITYTPSLTSINAFPNVTEIDFINVAEQASLQELAFPELERAASIRLSVCNNLTTLDFTSLTEIIFEFESISLELQELNSLTNLSGFANLETTSNGVDILSNDDPFEISLSNICMLRDLYVNNATDQNDANDVLVLSECYYFDSSFVTVLEFDTHCNCP
ncbi:MAG: hypothetical protein AAF489_08910 [Bacteroidota bacterium]